MNLSKEYINKQYWLEDLYGLIRNSPYRQVMGEGIIYYIEKIHRKCSDYQDILELYPNVKCEYLEEVYELHKLVSTHNDTIINELFDCGWRGQIIASLLILLKPDKKYEEQITEIHDSITNTNKKMIFKLTLDVLTQKNTEFNSQCEFIRNSFKQLTQQPYFLRANISEKYESRLISEKKEFTKIYKEQGVKDANNFLDGTLLQYLLARTFEDNQMLMEVIQESIALTIDFMLDEGELKKINNND